MKKIKGLLLVLLVILTTGCSGRKAISPEEFKNNSKNFVAVDIKETMDFAEAAYKVIGDNNMEVIYIKCNDKNVIKRMYYDETTNVVKKATLELQLKEGNNDKEYSMDDIDKSIIKEKNFTIAGYNLKEKYYRLSWIDDTIIYGSIDIGAKSTLVNYMKKMNY